MPTKRLPDGWDFSVKYGLSHDANQKTADCLAALHRTTTVDELLKLSCGNKWIVRRAIALYNRGVHRLAGYPAQNLPRGPIYGAIYAVKV